VLEISELRSETDSDEPSTRDWLRTSAGTVGVALLVAGAYGIWRGAGRQNMNS
jgi:hypothetical protein